MAIFKGNMRTLAFHVLVLLVYYATIVAYVVNTIRGWNQLAQFDQTIHSKKFAPFFYSLWGYAVQVVCYSLILAAEIIRLIYPKEKELVHLRNKLLKISNNLLFSVVFPTAPLIFLLFWGLFLYDRDVIYPEYYDSYFPKYLNHALHTFPLFVVFPSVVICGKNIPSRKSAFSRLAFYNTTYVVLFILIKYLYGRWPYLGFERISYYAVMFILVQIIVWPPIFQMIGYKIYKSYRHKDE